MSLSGVPKPGSEAGPAGVETVLAVKSFSTDSGHAWRRAATGPLGMLTIDSLHAGDLTDLDIAFMKYLAQPLAAGLSTNG